MKTQFRKKLLVTSLMAVSSGVVMPAVAQSSPGAITIQEIVVTARRREETVQDVPLTVNAVTGDQIEALNIRNFEDLEGVVAGLTLNEDSIAPDASVRGVRFDTFTGTSPTVEFYLNDTPGSPLTVMQAMFDIGQIEVLRGPQGTLRGRASPSGSITVSTQKPVFNEFGGYIDVTGTDIDGKNVKGAINIPVVDDMLAIRLAGVWEENNGEDVTNVFSGETSERESDGVRLSVAFEPTDNLSMNLMYQKLNADRNLFAAVESANISNPSLPASDIFITAEDRLAVQDLYSSSEQELEATTLNIGWEFVDGHQLSFDASYINETIDRPNTTSDPTNAIDQTQSADWQGHGQGLSTVNDGYSMEFRLQSTEPMFDEKLDYVVGALISEARPASNVLNQSLVRVTIPAGVLQIPGLPADFPIPVAHVVANTQIFSGGDSEETSYFGNLTYHITDDTELSGGLRRIELDTTRKLVVGSNTLQDGADDYSTTIYAASLKHNFTDDLMAYVSYGESWRRGINVVGDFSLVQSPTQQKFTFLGPEESDSIEIGFKTSLLEDSLRINAAAFHQEFDNYPYRPSQGVYYANYEFGGFGPNGPIINPVVGQHNFVGGVPVEVDGVEVEAFWAATENLNLGVLFSYAKGEVDNGIIPCNDYLPNDGVPDSGGQVPTLGDIFAAAGSENLTECAVSLRSNNAPLWTTTFTGEYGFVIGSWDAYVRGLWTVYGDSKNDPTNPLDDVDSYNILSLYTGLKDPEGHWEFMLFAKNVTDTEEVIRRNATPGSVGFTLVDGLSQQPYGNGTVISDYREVGMTAPREFGINLRYNF